MKKYIAVLEIDDEEEIIDASVSYVYRSNGTNYSTTESVEFKEESEGRSKKTYEEGLNEAWEAARTVVEMGEYDRKNVVFVRLDDGEFPFKKYSASEAITRIKEYENRIEVGDEVHTIYDDTPMVVVNIFNEDVTGEKRVVSVSISGMVSTRYVEELEKTGRHFPQIEEVLKQMQEDSK